jgi:hypothetical protein
LNAEGKCRRDANSAVTQEVTSVQEEKRRKKRKKRIVQWNYNEITSVQIPYDVKNISSYDQ